MSIQLTLCLATYFLFLSAATAQSATANKPWPEPLPFVVKSKSPNAQLAIVSYKGDMPEDNAPFVRDVFKSVTDDITNDYGVDGILNRTLVQIGGKAEVILEFNKGPISVNGQTAVSMLETMFSFFDNHSLRELYCNIQIDDQNVASLTLQMGPGPKGSLDELTSTYPEGWQHLNEKLYASPSPLAVGRTTWPASLPWVVRNSNIRPEDDLTITRYGMDIAYTSHDIWFGYIQQAFGYMRAVISYCWGPNAPDPFHFVNRNVQQFGGDRRVVLMFTVSRDEGVYENVLQELLETILAQIRERGLRGVRYLIKESGGPIGEVELALWNWLGSAFRGGATVETF